MFFITSILRKLGLFEYARIFKHDVDYFFKNTMKNRFKIFKKNLSTVLSYYLSNSYKISQEEAEIWTDIITTINQKLLSYNSFGENAPLVSIIILNRNGLEHLKRLFSTLKENTDYPNYEIIVWDNDSNDKSLSYLNSIKDDFNLKIHKNKSNFSFSKANNEAVKLANGEYILFLNNDIETTLGWLSILMETMLSSDNIASAGSKLIYPNCSNSLLNYKNSFKVQHAGIAFEHDEHFLKPFNLQNGEFIDFSDIKNKKIPALTAATLLVDKSKFLEVGGFDEEYVYGYEDVDLSLKFLKKGYDNIYCPKSMLFHYEFGSQEKSTKRETKLRRLKNKEIFNKKWKNSLYNTYLLDKINVNNFYSDKPFTIAFAVSESNPETDKGDYFTALELSRCLEDLKIKTILLDKNNWYNIPGEVDVLITMLDSYDLKKIYSNNKSLIKIAWPRNWFSRWVENKSFLNYDLILSPSSTVTDFIEEKTDLDSFLFPIATNHKHFNSNNTVNNELKCDYCFTGSYWNDKRDIIEYLEPEEIPFKLNIYGRNWENFEKFKDHYKGFLDYSKIPDVYASTELVIDDANRVTKEWGSVNSRVYDALASGVLVITNSESASIEIFDSKLPVYKSKEDLTNKINYYLNNPDEREKLTEELSKIVLENHTYEKRAKQLKNILIDYIQKRKLAIKIAVPKLDEIEQWGDYHFAKALKKSFDKLNYHVKIDILPCWDYEYEDRDIILVLRGLNRYSVKEHHYNVMWNISHPDRISFNEYETYDHVFIASKIWFNYLDFHLKVPVDTLLQCTDSDLFYPDYDEKYAYDLLFVGNSRKVYRKIIKDLIPTDYDLAIYGKDWEGLVDGKYIKGEHIPNKELRKAYSSCKILLNDHWEDMRQKGFISNRIFDGLACSALLVSDKVNGTKDLFGENFIMYEDEDDLKNKIDFYIKDENRKNYMPLKHHTFFDRAKTIDETYTKYLSENS